MAKHEGITRKEFLWLAGSAATFAGGVGLVSLAGRRAITLERRLDRLLRDQEEIERIARACHIRWTINKRYKPQLAEVMQWVSTVVLYDDLIRDTLHYCAMIDLESLGNPTLYLPSDGHTRGLGSMLVTTAQEVVDAEKLHVKAVGTSLFNPHFAIFAMIRHYEDLLVSGPRKARTKWALYAYNAGRGKARRRLAKKQVIPAEYYEEHKYRKMLIKGEMK